MRTLRRGRSGRCRVRWSTTNAAAAIGTPTKKHQRQPSAESVITPPSSGPPTVPTAMTEPRYPM